MSFDNFIVEQFMVKIVYVSRVVLKLPGVSENRPSVLRGDHLLLTKSEEVTFSNVTKYKGYVHRVELDQVKLGLSRRYEASPVRFRVRSHLGCLFR